MSSQLAIRPRHTGLNMLLGAAAFALVGAVIAIMLFFANGGRWFVVATPSMGTAAPVGTLVLTRPTTVSALHVGDIITFHPSTAPGETYTHRITTISADGAVSTRGDINGATDPWVLHDADLLGRASAVLPGVGWLVRGVPTLVLGLIIVFLLTHLVRSRQWRASLRIVGACLVISIAAIWLRPFTGVQVLQTFVHGSYAGATVVSTGLLPTRVTAVQGNHVDLLSGSVGQLSIPTYLHDDYYRISSALHLDLVGWIVFLVICCLPLIGTLVFGLPAKNRVDEERTA